MNNFIAIAGLGWLGLPLAQRLLMLGYRVKGSVSSLEKAAKLQQSDFEAYRILLSETAVQGEVKALLANTKILVIMIPPGLRRNSGSDYVLKMVHLLEAIQKFEVKKVLFVSSTSVYSDAQGQVFEKNLPQPDTEAGKQLLQVEQLYFNASFIDTTVVRFGGLIGGSRQPVRYLSGREDLSNGEAPVNLIHRNDCLAILSEIIKQDAFGHIFNAVHPNHPSKRDYYTAKAKEMKLDPPSYNDGPYASAFKRVDSSSLESVLGFTFKEAL